MFLLWCERSFLFYDVFSCNRANTNFVRLQGLKTQQHLCTPTLQINYIVNCSYFFLHKKELIEKRYGIRNSPLYIHKDRRDIFGREYLQHWLQTSDNMTISAQCATVCATR